MSQKDVLKKFMETNEVLIVDKNPGSRNRLLKIMYDLGWKRHMIHTAGNISEVISLIETKKIGVVLSDYMIGGGSGFDLFKLLRSKDPNNKELCQILVTANISQSAVAKAAEEEVDSFIIKPYTVQSIQESLVSCITAKIKPSPYMLKVEEGKSLIAQGKFKEAIDVLKEATKLNDKPALALFYIGQAEYLTELVENAQGSYKQGLTFNNIHYKCLVGLFDIFISQGKLHEAYHVVKKIAKYFPANPDRLAQIIRLSVQTGNFEDMQFYYEIFTSLEERTTQMINYIGAGMYIAGKHYLINQNTTVALQYFDNIAVSCSEFTKFLRAMIIVLVDYEKADEAQKFMKRFPAGSKDSEDFLICDFLISAKLNTDANFIVKNGLEIYNRKIKDERCLKVLIDAMKRCGYKEDKIQTFESELSALAA
ncbi:MAG: response regulator [Bacteriovoracaceae bacterium]